MAAATQERRLWAVGFHCGLGWGHSQQAAGRMPPRGVVALVVLPGTPARPCARAPSQPT
jgi:hypothetical protein